LNENAVLQSRLSGLEAGGTVEGSEVIGIRTGADGTVYATAGDAVRGQIDAHAVDIYDNKKNVLEQCGAFMPSLEWEQGSILDASYTTRIRTTHYTKAVGDITVDPSEGYRVGVMLYTRAGNAYTSVVDTGWKTSKYTIPDSAGYYYKVHISRADGANVALSESAKVLIVEAIAGSRLEEAHNFAVDKGPVLEKLFGDVYTDLCGYYVPVHEWEQGSYVADSNAQTDRIRTKAGVYYKALGTLSITVGAGYRAGVRLYSLTDGTYTVSYDSGWHTGAFEVPGSAGSYYRLSISHADDTSKIETTEHTSVSVIHVLNDDSELKKLEKKIDGAVKISATSMTVKTVAHRGDIMQAPECTEPAYIAARRRGHTTAENDLRISKDGEFVMWHDPTLSKLGNIKSVDGYMLYTDGVTFYWYDSVNNAVYTTGVEGYAASSVLVSQLTLVNGAQYSVADFDLATLKLMDFGVWYGAEFTGTKILTFAEWVLLCKKLGMDIYVDYKFTYTNEQAERLVGIVRRYGMLRHVSWICNTTMANYIRYYDPKARIGFLTIPSAANVQTYSAYLRGGPVFYDGNAADVTSEVVALGHDAGFEVEAYYVAFGSTAREDVYTELRRLFETGVQTITTDHYHASEAFDYMLM
jgi:glycerophosphoryl diester phosphodiesterase